MLTQKTCTAISLGSVFFGAGCNSHDTTPHSTEKGHLHGPRTHMHVVPPDAEAYEKDDLHRMSHHHASAIALSKLAEQKATHAELKASAAAAVTRQEAEIATMRKWLAKRYGRDLAPHVTDDVLPVLDRLSALPPDQFDRAFLEAMVRHDQQGVALARSLDEQAPHTDVQALAKQIITEQSKEAVDMTNHLRQWYGADASTAPG